jgi:hypothetical protein
LVWVNVHFSSQPVVKNRYTDPRGSSLVVIIV